MIAGRRQHQGVKEKSSLRKYANARPCRDRLSARPTVLLYDLLSDLLSQSCGQSIGHYMLSYYVSNIVASDLRNSFSKNIK